MNAQPKVKAPKLKVPKVQSLSLVSSDTTKRIPAPEFILGLDVSLEHTGWALFNTRTGEIKSGVWEPNPVVSKKIVKLVGMKRLAWLRDRILHMARYGKEPGPMAGDEEQVSCLVFIEGYAYGAKGSSGISLGEMGGVLRLGFYDEGIGYLEISPLTTKKFVTGVGKAEKSQMLKEVYKRWGADFNDDNECDAYALMQIGRALTNTYEGDLIAVQKDIVADLMKTWLKEHPDAAL